MSKERARRRLERELQARQRELDRQAARGKIEARARRRARWFGWLPTRRTRRVDPRVRERRAVVSSAFLVIVVLSWVATRSLLLTLGVFIVAAVATPAVVTLLSDKRR
ncbi:MAG TPA: hypothetical protein VHO01_11510 [Jatrophihabitans sp.]|nr:hypothetical protein [Jatrophihabitans sp.]